VDEWDRWLAAAGVDDIYFTLRYARIWERDEQGRAVGIRHTSERGTVLYPLLQIPLDALTLGEGLCDLRTPYDFGGPLALGPDPEALLAEYAPLHRELARDWKVVSELARLHPFAHRAVPQDATFHAEHSVVDLRGGYDSVSARYHGNQRNFVRVARRAGVEVEIRAAAPPSVTDVFFDMYRETMAALGAAGHYYFLRETVLAVASLDECLLAVARHDHAPVASSLFLRSDRDLFYFLSGSDRRSLPLRPNNLLLDEVARHAIALGCARVHLGGGSPGLRHFKSQIGTSKVPYFVLRRIYQPETYERLRAANGGAESPAFPAYRDALRARATPVSSTTVAVTQEPSR
jgi:hypothetical protein